MSVTNRDIWPVLKELFLEQYKGDLKSVVSSEGCTLPEGADNRFQGLLKAAIDELIQPLDDACVELQDLLDVDTATGARLDLIGKLANLERGADESDAHFRERVLAALWSDSAGTPDYAIQMAASMSGDPKPQYMDEADATFIIYTGPRPDGNGIAEGGGHQLLRRQVKKLAPAGVLGLPGAAIQFCDGSLMGDQDGKLMMMVADDANVEHDLVLGDETGNVISTPQGVPVKVVIKGGQTVPTIPVDIGGTTYDAVRIKDLPDASAEHNGYMVRDSEEGGTVKTDAITEQEFDTLWDNTPAESDEEEDNG